MTAFMQVVPTKEQRSDIEKVGHIRDAATTGEILKYP